MLLFYMYIFSSFLSYSSPLNFCSQFYGIYVYVQFYLKKPYFTVSKYCIEVYCVALNSINK